jgi:hypothetical protein
MKKERRKRTVKIKNKGINNFYFFINFRNEKLECELKKYTFISIEAYIQLIKMCN